MRPVIVTIHQPEHLPWLGFFQKISQADLFVILDSVQFRKNYFQNRNKIRTMNGWTWLTVPVKRNINTLIKDVEIDNNQNWRRKCWNSIYFAYKKALFFSEYSNALEKFYKQDWINLCELNIHLIKQFLSFLSLEPIILRSSEINVHGKGSELILNICKKVDADTYLLERNILSYLILKKQELRLYFKSSTILFTNNFMSPLFLVCQLLIFCLIMVLIAWTL
jgi:hypothetical protein